MSKVRILVLTSSTGGGHDASAEAFADWCFQLYRHDVDVRIEQMLEKSSVVNRAGVNFYNKIQASAPWVHKAFYAFVEIQSILNKDTVSLGRRYYVNVLKEYKPHLVLSVHDCLNRGYFQLARKVLGPDNVACATYCGEFSGGWGYSRNWIEPTADMYFSRTATAQDYAIKKGIPKEKARVRGYLMHPHAHYEVIAPQERGIFREERLGLRPDLFTVFLATGGNGANNHFDLLPALVKRADRCQAIVICGRNKQAYNDLVHWRANHPGVQLLHRGLFRDRAPADAGERRHRHPRGHDDLRQGAPLQVPDHLQRLRRDHAPGGAHLEVPEERRGLRQDRERRGLRPDHRLLADGPGGLHPDARQLPAAALRGGPDDPDRRARRPRGRRCPRRSRRGSRSGRTPTRPSPGFCDLGEGRHDGRPSS
jgi:UDP-N-acetylglucosamine:LPS N-acetylglucosamine transferase